MTRRRTAVTGRMRMTMTPLELEATRAWAAGQLGVPVAAAPDEARQAFLAQLQRDGFLPPPALDYAFRVLAGFGNAPGADLGWQQARMALETTLWSEVELFAGEF